MGDTPLEWTSALSVGRAMVTSAPTLGGIQAIGSANPGALDTRSALIGNGIALKTKAAGKGKGMVLVTTSSSSSGELVVEEPACGPDELEEEDELGVAKEELKDEELSGHGEAIERLKLALPHWVDDVPLMVKRHPKLLRTDPDVLASRLEKLRELLPMAEDELAKIVRAQPSLVSHSPEALASTVRQLSCLVPSEVDVGYLLSSRPILLKQSAKTLEANWESLRKYAAMVPRWKQELDLFSKRRSTALGNLLLYGRKKHRRLERIASLGPAMRDRYALSTIFNMKDDAFEDKFDPDKVAAVSSLASPSKDDDHASVTAIASATASLHQPAGLHGPPKRQMGDADFAEATVVLGEARHADGGKGVVAATAPVPTKLVTATTKRPRGSREPFCPKCANPKCHKSHTYTAPCVREGMVKPIRAKPKSHATSSKQRRSPLDDDDDDDVDHDDQRRCTRSRPTAPVPLSSPLPLGPRATQSIAPPPPPKPAESVVAAWHTETDTALV